jgi:LasA protease
MTSLINSKSKPNRLLHSIFAIFIFMSLSLGGCHFPQELPTKLPESPQRQTEIARILHPDELTPQSGEPAAELTPHLDDPPAEIQEPVLQPSSFVFGEEEITYSTQQGDTLPALAGRFEVPADAIQSVIPLPPTAFLPIGAQVKVPNHLENVLPYHNSILPDSELIYGPSVDDFNAADFAREAGGFLAAYSEDVKGQSLTGPEIVQWVALETSTNPRLLLAFLEYRSGWVFGSPSDAASDDFPIGYGANDKGLYNELMISAKLLAQGFYGWREGSFKQLKFSGSTKSYHPSPALNAGSVGLMHLFASLYEKDGWTEQLIEPGEFLLFYHAMFGNFWDRAIPVEPYLLATTTAPELALPFAIGEVWSLTGGPHISWQTGTPFGALDFAPVTGEPQCAVSARWATAAAPGLVARSDRGVVALDLDGDGDEGTGWVLIYLHMAEEGRVPLNTWLERDDPVGHPSCEGGTSSGTHLHFAWKFNGEWVGVEEPLPLIISGWRVIASERRYEGFLQKEDQIVTSRPNESSGSTIIRTD